MAEWKSHLKHAVIIILFCGGLILLFNYLFTPHDSSVKFHSGLKVTILNGTTETVYYEVVTLPHRNEVYGRLRLNLPTVISQNSSAHLYVRSSIHQINLKGYTANYTRIFSPFELVRPRPVIYNHMTLSDRFTDASIRAKRAGEKIHTVTIIQIASSLNGTWYQLHLHKTFQVMLDVDAFLKALGQVKCMPLQQLSFGPFTRAEEDILYDDAD